MSWQQSWMQFSFTVSWIDFSLQCCRLGLVNFVFFFNWVARPMISLNMLYAFSDASSWDSDTYSSMKSGLFIQCAGWSFFWVKPAQSESGQENYTSLNGLLHGTQIHVVKMAFRDSYSWSPIILRKNVFLVFLKNLLFLVFLQVLIWAVELRCDLPFPVHIIIFVYDLFFPNKIFHRRLWSVAPINRCCVWEEWRKTAPSGAIGPRHLILLIHLYVQWLGTSAYSC